MMKRPLLLFIVLVLATAVQAAVETYKIDPIHSSVGFTIRHFVSKIPGYFDKFSGIVTVDRANLENSSIDATIDVASIDTKNDKRDTHLKTPDFFNAAKFSTITFKSKSWKKTGENTFDVTGYLRIKGVTKEIVLNVTLLGFTPGMRGAQLCGWEASTTLNRSDFGVSGPLLLGTALGNEVAVTIEIEADLLK
ncbi:MAG: YceI family protein [Opitutaceae bacterium]